MGYTSGYTKIDGRSQLSIEFGPQCDIVATLSGDDGWINILGFVGQFLSFAPGWRQIPADAISQMQAKLGGGQNFSFVDGMEPAKHSHRFEYPYGLIQRTDDPSGRHISSVSEKELQQIVAAVSGVSQADLKKAVPGEASSLISNVGKINASYFTSPPGFTMEMTMNVQGIGAVHGKSIGFLGKDHLLMLNLYSRQSEWETNAPNIQKMLDGFQIDESQKISFGAQSEMGGVPFSRVLGRIAGFCVIGALVAVFIGWKFKKA